MNKLMMLIEFEIRYQLWRERTKVKSDRYRKNFGEQNWAWYARDYAKRAT